MAVGKLSLRGKVGPDHPPAHPDHTRTTPGHPDHTRTTPGPHPSIHLIGSTHYIQYVYIHRRHERSDEQDVRRTRRKTNKAYVRHAEGARPSHVTHEHTERQGFVHSAVRFRSHEQSDSEIYSDSDTWHGTARLVVKARGE
jgi:hypothetical protein